MKTANLRRVSVQSGSRPGSDPIALTETRSVSAPSTQTDTNNTFVKVVLGATVSLLNGLFALWLSLTILSLIGLTSANGEFLPWLSLRIAVASVLALILCVDGLPLIFPWCMAFVPAYFFIPSKSVLWKTWICTVSGVVVGILAVWVDAIVYTWFTDGLMSSLNISLLKSASIPAAILGGATCFAAAAGRRFFRQPSASVAASTDGAFQVL